MKQTLWLVAKGHSLKEIADFFGTRVATVSQYGYQLRSAFEVSSFEELQRIAFLWAIAEFELYERLRPRDVRKRSFPDHAQP